MNRKILYLIIVLFYLPTLSWASQGICGQNVTWVFYANTVTLNISGYGSMFNYVSAVDGMNGAPWRTKSTYIETVIIEDYVDYIGDYAFWECYNIRKVTIPNSVNSIGSYVWGHCTRLTDVYCYAHTVPSTGESVFNMVNLQNATLHVPNASINAYRNTEPWSGFGHIVGLNDTEYVLSYILDGSEYKSYSLCEGQTIIPEPDPIREGYTFSGWSEIPEVMPAHDVTVIGSMTVNKYKLIYKVNGEEYKSYDVEYGTSITPEPALVQEGYTFSGWSEIPATMPAHDVTVTGSFTINKYKLTYKVDGELYNENEVEFNSVITPLTPPMKEGYTFSGWSEIPEVMPAHDVTITGTFTINKYKVTYKVEETVIATEDVEYGATIVPPATDSNGNPISWNSHPTTMPAYDITIYGSYTTTIDAINNLECKIKYYTLDGQPIEQPRSGINIIKMSDGTVKKVVIK